MPSPLSNLIERLKDAIAGNDERKAAVEKVLSGSANGLKFPLVHRTGDRKRGNVVERIFVDGQLRRPSQPSKREAELDMPPAVYFFYGVGAYPEGNVALVFPPKTAESEDFSQATFTPFDSGGLGTPPYHDCSSLADTWAQPKVRKKFLDEHTGHCNDLARFSEIYLAAHFKDHVDYVRRPQYSDPDWPPYHGLTSKRGDRRVWTIEVRNPQSVSLDGLEAILLDRAHRRRVRDTYFGFVKFVECSDGFDRGIARHVEDNHCKLDG